MQKKFVLNSYITDNEKKQLNEAIYLYLEDLGCKKACNELLSDEHFTTDTQNFGKYKHRLVQKWKVLLEYQRKIRFLEEDNFQLKHQLKKFKKEEEGEEDSEGEESLNMHVKSFKAHEVIDEGSLLPLVPYERIIKHTSDRTKRILCASVHPKQSVIITGSMDSKIAIWNYKSSKLLKTLTEHTYPIRAIAFSKSGKKFASSCDGDNIFVWDYKYTKKIASLRGHKFRITTLTWSHDDAYIFSGADDESFRIWDGIVHKPVFTFFRKGKSFSSSGYGKITCIDVSKNNEILVVGSSDCFVRTFEIRTRRMLHTVKHKSSVEFVVFSNQKNNDYIADNYDVTMSLVDRNMGSIFVLSGSRRDKDVFLWDTRTGEVIAKFNNPNSLHPVCALFHPLGKLVLVLYSNYEILFFNIEDAVCVKKIKIEETTNMGEIINLSLSQKNKVLLQTDVNSTRIWKLV